MCRFVKIWNSPQFPAEFRNGLSTSSRVILISVQLFLQGGIFRLKQESRSLKVIKTSTRKEAFVSQGYGFCLPPKFKLTTPLRKHFLYSYLAHQKVCVIKMPAVHFRRLSRRALDLHAHLHAFTSFSERLVVGFNASNNPDIQKLQNTVIWN